MEDTSISTGIEITQCKKCIHKNNRTQLKCGPDFEIFRLDTFHICLHYKKLQTI